MTLGCRIIMTTIWKEDFLLSKVHSLTCVTVLLWWCCSYFGIRLTTNVNVKKSMVFKNINVQILSSYDTTQKHITAMVKSWSAKHIWSYIYSTLPFVWYSTSQSEHTSLPQCHEQYFMLTIRSIINPVHGRTSNCINLYQPKDLMDTPDLANQELAEYAMQWFPLSPRNEVGHGLCVSDYMTRLYYHLESHYSCHFNNCTVK